MAPKSAKRSLKSAKRSVKRGFNGQPGVKMGQLGSKMGSQIHGKSVQNRSKNRLVFVHGFLMRFWRDLGIKIAQKVMPRLMQESRKNETKRSW